MRLGLFIYLSFFISIAVVKAQENPVDISGHSDCKTALKIETDEDFGPTSAPVDYGKLQEFKGNSKTSLYYFEDEHHSVWYKFICPYSGYLVFEIRPLSLKDDYDFLLYKVNAPNFCNLILKKSVKPVRTNIARNDPSIQGKTGLKTGASNKYKDSGPGNSYSQAVKVKAGELFYLVLDNIYEGGAGHCIAFDYLKESGESAVKHIIKGRVTEEGNGKMVAAKVILEDKKTGAVVAVAKTDEAGNYQFSLPKDFDMKKEYNLAVSSKGYFFRDIEVVPENYRDQAIEDAKVRRLLKGKSYSFTDINFYPDSPQFLPGSERILDKMLRMMKENPNINIEIEGHIDGCKGDPESRRILSEGRAETVKKYLTDHGVDPLRISTKGYGCAKMMYPDPENEEEKRLNRRVELKITKS